MSQIHKTHNRLISFLGLITIAVFGIIGTLSTGGDGKNGLERLIYIGNTDPAIITLANAPTLMANVLYGGNSTSNIPTGVTASSSKTLPGDTLVVADYLLTAFHYSLDNILGNTTNGYNIPKSLVIDETIYCESGYFTMKGTLDDYTATGTLTLNYVNCLTEGITYNGSGSFTINSMDFYNLDVTMDFTLLSITSYGFNVSVSDNIRLEISISGNTLTDRMTMNYVSKDNNTGKMYKFENFIMSSIIDDIYSLTSSGSISFTGTQARVYDSVYGYVSVDTPTPLLYSSITLIYPDNGGEMMFSGNNSEIELIVMSGRHIKLNLNLDGIAGYEAVRYLLWEETAVNANTDLTDSDNDGMHDSWETTYGLDPNVDDSTLDLDSDTFSNIIEYQSGTIPNDVASHP